MQLVAKVQLADPRNHPDPHCHRPDLITPQECTALKNAAHDVMASLDARGPVAPRAPLSFL